MTRHRGSGTEETLDESRSVSRLRPPCERPRRFSSMIFGLVHSDLPIEFRSLRHELHGLGISISPADDGPGAALWPPNPTLAAREFSSERSRGSMHEVAGKVTDLEFGGLSDVIPVLLEPEMDLLETRLEVRLGLVVENPPRFLDRGKKTCLLVPITPLLEDDARVVAGEPVDPIGEVEDPDLLARREVNCLTDGLVVMSTCDQTIHDVSDVSEIARFLSSARDRQRLSVHRPIEEVWDYVAITSGHLPGSVGVEESRVDNREPVQVAVHICIQLSKHLRDLVWRVEVHGRVIFREGHRGVRAVNATARGSVNQALDAGLAGSLENLEYPHAVDHEI